MYTAVDTIKFLYRNIIFGIESVCADTAVGSQNLYMWWNPHAAAIMVQNICISKKYYELEIGSRITAIWLKMYNFLFVNT
jgi:hypothetical protein